MSTIHSNDDLVLVSRRELWKLAADLHAPGNHLWDANDDEVFTVEDVRSRIRGLADRPESGAAASAPPEWEAVERHLYLALTRIADMGPVMVAMSDDNGQVNRYEYRDLAHHLVNLMRVAIPA